MKQIILLSVCVFSAIFSAEAQTESKNQKDKKIKFGLRTGYEFQVNDSNLDNKLDLPYIGILSDIIFKQ